MRSILLTFCAIFVFATVTNAQFRPSEKGLTIMVSDGTKSGKNSQVQRPSDIPTSYDQIPGSGAKKAKSGLNFTDPIRELGMTECIQAAAFLERPTYGKTGFMLIFCINDSIGGEQATLEVDGQTYRGVYRLIRQKLSSSEPVPAGMTSYQATGTFFLLGIS